MFLKRFARVFQHKPQKGFFAIDKQFSTIYNEQYPTLKGARYCMASKVRRLLMCAGMLTIMILLFSAQEAKAEKGLPVDFTGGAPLNQAFFTDAFHYEDRTISVAIKQGRTEEGCDYWVASVKIAHASQLRTAAANGFDSDMVMDGRYLARRVNAVLAIDGDYFSYTGEGYILRQGELFLNVLVGRRDVLLIDEDGDFHIIEKPKKGEVHKTIEGKKVINAFYFGPALVIDGQVHPNMSLDEDMAANDRKQRMCIAQVGPLEYKCICCGPPARGNTGMTLMEFAQLVADQGVQTAYNLDGGNSCMMLFNNRKINDVESEYTREINDIIYFASAYGVN